MLQMDLAPSATENALAPALPKGLEVLLIEDSATIRGLMRKVLERAFANAHVREAADGREAIRELAHGRVDIIVTDLQMPRMDGCDFLRRLRQNPLLAAKPVVVISSEDPASLGECLATDPALRFVPKASRPGAMETAIRELLNLPA